MSACIDALANAILIELFDALNSLKTGQYQTQRVVSAVAAEQRRSMLAITHTCARWRRIALGTPSLWTHIYISPRLSAVIHAQRSLSLSGTLPLAIYLYPGKGGMADSLSGAIPGTLARARKPVI